MKTVGTLGVFAASVTLAAVFAAPLQAQDYNFDVQYFGNGVSTLAGGSDNPDGTVLNPGDSFFWSITAQNDAYWHVVNGGSFFPLMAFATNPSGRSTGEYTFQLFLDGLSVFSLTETSSQEYFHVGTNSVSLATDVQFDRMTLSYLLLDAVPDAPPDLLSLQDMVETTLSGNLPIFGAPEENSFSPGIEYVTTVVAVPEPASVWLLSAGMLVVTVMLRRRMVRA